MFERKNEKVVPVSVFAKRLAGSVAAASCLVLVVLLIGMVGYHSLGGFDWVDSLLEASMILGGMGPVNPLKTTPVKLFASGYALFSGLVFIAVMGIILTPVAHRLMHKFHVE
jgi:hypothetical protein